VPFSSLNRRPNRAAGGFTHAAHSVQRAAALFMVSAAVAGPVERPAAYDELIASQAKIHGVPVALVHRTVLRESRYNPALSIIIASA